MSDAAVAVAAIAVVPAVAVINIVTVTCDGVTDATVVFVHFGQRYCCFCSARVDKMRSISIYLPLPYLCPYLLLPTFFFISSSTPHFLLHLSSSLTPFFCPFQLPPTLHFPSFILHLLSPIFVPSPHPPLRLSFYLPLLSFNPYYLVIYVFIYSSLLILSSDSPPHASSILLLS